MLPGKRGHADLQKVPADKRLRVRIGNLLLTNSVSAQEAGRLYEDAAASGASHVKDMAALASKRKDKVSRKREYLAQAVQEPALATAVLRAAPIVGHAAAEGRAGRGAPVAAARAALQAAGQGSQ